MTASWVGSRGRYLEDALDEADLSFISETYAFKNVICESDKVSGGGSTAPVRSATAANAASSSLIRTA